MAAKGKFLLSIFFFDLLLLRLPVGRGGVVNSPRFCFFFHLSMSKVGLPLMGDTAGFSLLFSAFLHII